jgi:hypothetical protein
MIFTSAESTVLAKALSSTRQKQIKVTERRTKAFLRFLFLIHLSSL